MQESFQIGLTIQLPVKQDNCASFQSLFFTLMFNLCKNVLGLVELQGFKLWVVVLSYGHIRVDHYYKS